MNVLTLNHNQVYIPEKSSVVIVGIENDSSLNFVERCLERECEVHAPVSRESEWLQRSDDRVSKIRSHALFNVHYVSRNFSFDNLDENFFANTCDGYPCAYVYSFNASEIEFAKVYFPLAGEMLTLYSPGVYLVLSKTGCKWCVEAKHLLNQKRESYTVEMTDAILDQERDVFKDVVAKWISPVEHSTFPYIFDKDGRFVGGFDKLKAMFE